MAEVAKDLREVSETLKPYIAKTNETNNETHVVTDQSEPDENTPLVLEKN